LLKGNLKEVLENLCEDLTADQGGCCGNGWNDFSSFEFDLVGRKWFNGVVGGSEVREESNEVNMTIRVIIFFELDFLNKNTLIAFHIVNQTIYKFG
jgi:hypothetical protein